jgi:hypothetical protein
VDSWLLDFGHFDEEDENGDGSEAEEGMRILYADSDMICACIMSK